VTHHYIYKRIVLLAVSVLLLLSVEGSLMAQTAKPLESADIKENQPLPVEMTTKVVGHEVYPGDEVLLTVTFASEKEFGAEVLGSLSLGEFEFKDRSKSRGEVDGGFQMIHNFVLINFKAGDHEIPQIPFVIKQGGKQQERKSDLVKVKVKSLLQEEAQKIALQQMRDKQAQATKGGSKGQAKIVDPNQADPNLPTMTLPPGQVMPGQIPGQAKPGQMPQGQQVAGQEPQQIQLAPRDIKKPQALIQDDYTLAYVAGVLLFVILLIIFIIWWRRRPEKEVEEVEEDFVDTRAAHLIAFEKLDLLERKQLVAKRLFKEYHLEMSEIIKEYFQRRYELEDAPSLTSSEMAARLRELYLKDLNERIVAELLSACDMVLFAKVEPDDVACHERLKQARLIVERTKEADNGIQ